MGFFFTLLYIMTGYFSPTALFGDLAQYRLEMIIVGLAVLFSVPSLGKSGVSKMPQSWAIAGLCFAVFCSIMFNGLFAYAPETVIELLPAIACFFLVVVNCRTRMRLQILVACIFVFAAFVIAQGYLAIQHDDLENAYLLDMGYGGEHVLRIRGLGIFNDPNDFGQLMVGLIPYMFFFWHKGSVARNLLLVYAPVALLVYGMYLTHSRGGMLALMVMAIFAARRKIGLIPGVVGGGLVFLALSAAGFSGGRDVSASAGEDRISLWSQGLGIVRSHPIFGVGFNRFQEYTDVGLTAHNTFVVCVGEVGLVGVFFWLLMAVTTIRNAQVLGAGKAEEKPAEPVADGETAFASRAAEVAVSPGAITRMAATARTALPEAAFARAGLGFAPARLEEGTMPGAPFRVGALSEDGGETEDAEIRRMASLTVLSFAGFFTAGWFLSRSYTMALFVNAGIAAAIFQMAVERGFAPPQMPVKKMLKVTAITLVLLLLFVYIIIRGDHFLPK
jgi:O-antigen ligase